jgi:hypothetical protein
MEQLRALVRPFTACSIDGCDKRTDARGWCSTHYKRWQKHGDPLTLGKPGRPATGRPACTVTGCGSPSTARGMCENHYRRWERNGSPVVDGWDARRWANVDTTGECWIWTGTTDRHGYGRVRPDGRSTGAHRWSYEATVGPIPEGLELDHLCNNPPCVNPAHLEPVTHAENMRRMRERST